MKKLTFFLALFQMGLLASSISCAKGQTKEHQTHQEDEQTQAAWAEQLARDLSPPDESERPEHEMDRDPLVERRLVRFPFDCKFFTEKHKFAVMVFVEEGYLKVMGCDNLPRKKNGLAFVMPKDECRLYGDFAPIPIVADKKPKIYRMFNLRMEGKNPHPLMVYIFDPFESDQKTTSANIDYKCVPKSELIALFTSLLPEAASDNPNFLH